MPEIVRVEGPSIIRFGKHAGKSAAEGMATDPTYATRRSGVGFDSPRRTDRAECRADHHGREGDTRRQG